MGKSYHREIASAGFVALLFLSDRLSKLLALKFLSAGPSVEIFPFFHLTYAENTGAAFSILQNCNTFFIVVSLILITVLSVLRRGISSHGAAAAWGVIMVMGGALGNLYDRLVFGFVIDFLDFRVWPVFNLADSFISVGVCLMAWGMRNRGGIRDEG